MGRKKLTPEEQETQKTQQEALYLQRSLDELREQFKKEKLPKNPTRKFSVGDQVQRGAWGTTHVTEVLDDGLIYKIHADYMGESYGQPIRVVQDAYVEWLELFPYISQEENQTMISFTKKDNIFINFYQSTIDSLLHMVYRAGIDFKPDYQRELVWDLQQKRDLIKSVFNNIEIGKFTFIKNDYSASLLYEILDGKQRLTTLCEFFEGRFTYEGKTFAELSNSDKNHFTGFHIVWGDTTNLTKKQIYQLFLKLNTTGTPMDLKHLERIKELHDKTIE